ncbi:MAG: cysteine hydrolase family protein [Schwartzia sp. (in: firmicutes)]
MKKALIVIDMQNDFIDGSLGTKEAQAMLPRAVARVKAAASDPSTRLIFTQDTHDADYLRSAEGRKLPVPHCIKPQKGWEICPALSPYAKNALIIEKNTFGAAALPEAVKGCEEILFLGLCTDICVITNALLLKTFYPKVPIAVDPAACAGVTPESHQKALDVMKMCQIDIAPPLDGER